MEEKLNYIEFNYTDQFGNKYQMGTTIDFNRADLTNLGVMIEAYEKFLVVCGYSPEGVQEEMKVEL